MAEEPDALSPTVHLSSTILGDILPCLGGHPTLGQDGPGGGQPALLHLSLATVQPRCIIAFQCPALFT